MTKRKQKNSTVATSSGKRPSTARKPPKTRRFHRGERALEVRLQKVEATTTALALAVRYAVIRTLRDAKNPAGEVRRERQKALAAIKYITSLEQAMWVHELMRFYDAVIGHFSNENPGKRYLR